MGAHRGFCAVGIAGDNAIIDRLVRGIGRLLLAAGGQGHDALLGQPVGNLVVQGDEDRIARDLGQFEVEGNVGTR